MTTDHCRTCGGKLLPNETLVCASCYARAGGAANSPAGALELAYGLLWLTSVDRATKNGELVYQARQALLGVLDQDGKRRGVQAAMQAAAELEQSRKNSRTDQLPGSNPLNVLPDFDRG